MATKTFSGRANADELAYADSIARAQYGISFGQYCSGILLRAIQQTGKLPNLGNNALRPQKEEALNVIKGFSQHVTHPEVASLDESQIKDLIASKYE